MYPAPDTRAEPRLWASSVGLTFGLMRKLVARFVRNCHTCSRSKSRRHAKYGVLKPLPIPNQRWKDISMDFVTGFPLSGGFDAVLVVVDRLTKMRHFIPTNVTATAEDVADLYVNQVYRASRFPGYGCL